MFGWFKKSKKEYEALSDYSMIAVDMHSHVLPGIDDGAQTLEDSVALITSLKEAGIKKIIATPHIMADFYKNNAATIGQALHSLKEHLAAIQLDIEIEAAAEHYFDEYFLQLIETDQLMLINNKYVLFEMPFASRPPHVIPTIQQLAAKGLIPILAHPERYAYIDVDELKQLQAWGCLLQLNTISLTGYYGKSVKKAAEAMVDAGIVNFISSDMHHPKHAQAFSQALSEPYLRKLIDGNELKNIQLL